MITVQGPDGICNQETTKDKGNDALDEQEPPWEEGSHRVRDSTCFSHFC